MSRIGNKPITVPENVEIKLEGNKITVKGPKGGLSLDVIDTLKININEKELIEQAHYFDYHPYFDSINLIIRPQCNQQCSYCYITQYGDELYPIRPDRDETLHNVDLLLKYLYGKKL